jgi:hypothetical protein
MTEADDTLSRLLREPMTAERDEAFAAMIMDDVMRQVRLNAWTKALRNILLVIAGGWLGAMVLQQAGSALASEPKLDLSYMILAFAIAAVALAGPSARRWLKA